MSRRRERLARFFPLPLVSIAVLLLLLIFLTPNLTTPAGPLSTQAQLIVDQIPGSNSTHLYLRGIGTARYVNLSMGLATNLTWPPAFPLNTSIHFVVVASSNDSIGISAQTTANPVAVNVSAIYREASGSCVDYTGVYAFTTIVASSTLDYVDLSPAGSGAVSSTPVSSLPLSLLLNAVALGAC